MILSLNLERALEKVMQILLQTSHSMRTFLPFAFSLAFHLLLFAIALLPIENQLISSPKGSLRPETNAFVELVNTNFVQAPVERAKKEPKKLEGTVSVKTEQKKIVQTRPPEPQVARPPVDASAFEAYGDPNGSGPRTPLTEYLFGLRSYIDERKVYPPLSRRMGETGKVLVIMEVLRNGTIQDVKIKSGSKFPRLNEAALKTVSEVKQYKPLPDSVDQDKIAVVVPIEFTL